MIYLIVVQYDLSSKIVFVNSYEILFFRTAAKVDDLRMRVNCSAYDVMIICNSNIIIY